MAANSVLIGVVALASAGAGLGGFAVARAATGGTTEPAPTVGLYACPDPGSPAIGDAAAGDRVWIVGRTGDRWAVVRLPDDPGRMAWMPLASVAVEGDATLLPELACPTPDDASSAASAPATTTPPTSAPATSAAPSTPAPPSTAPPSAPASVPPSTAPPTTAPGAVTTTTAATTTTAVTSTTVAAATTTAAPTTIATTVTTATTTTVPPDTTPPGATVTPDRTTFHDVNGDPGCVDVVLATVTPTDDRPGAVVTGVVARWTGQAGPAELALVPEGGRYRLEVFSNPPATSAVVTITASVRDASGNLGAGTAQVTLLNAGSNGCVVG